MPAKGQTSWSDFHNQYLIDNYGNLTLNEIAAGIGKNRDAVDARRRRLGLQAIGLSERMKRLAREGKHPMHRPEVVARFLGDNNPSSRPDVKEKISQLRKIEYAAGTNKCGWKGPQKEPTKAEAALLGSLVSHGFVWNMPIHGGGCRNYRLDFAHREMKICIEIDGNSHRGEVKRIRDRRKDRFLHSQGWQVLRFTNEQVLSNRSLVLTAICDIIEGGDSH